MAGWFIERRAIATPTDISADVARHVATRCAAGPAIIVVPQPHSFLSAVRRQWFKLRRHMQRERASTLSSHKQTALAAHIQRMTNLVFRLANNWYQADVYIISPEDFTYLPDTYATLYVLCPLDTDQFTALTIPLWPHGVIVDYAGVRGANCAIMTDALYLIW